MECETKPDQAGKPRLTPLEATVVMIRRGRRDLLPRLRQQLAEHPEIYQRVGDLAAHAQRAWAELIGGPDDLFKESMILAAKDFENRLASGNASQVEKLAAARVAAAAMEYEYFRTWLAQHPEAEGTKMGELYRKRLDEADRRCERAMKTLTEIKRLLPRVIEVELVQKPVAPQAPIMTGSVNGNQTGTATASTKQFNALNRIGGRFAGHSEPFGELLEPSVAK